jgi:molybdate transport system ATP-binding protein
VALARALAAEPVVLLLDEPFGAVDVQAAAELRALLRRLLAETGQTCLMVTHDFADVATLADQVVVLESGRVVQSTSARGLLEAPSTEFSARLVGLNFLRSDSELVLFPPAAARVEECAGADGYRGTLLGVLSHGEDLRALVRAEHGTIEARVDPELGRRLVPGEAVVVAVDPARLRRAHGPG